MHLISMPLSSNGQMARELGKGTKKGLEGSRRKEGYGGRRGLGNNGKAREYSERSNKGIKNCKDVEENHKRVHINTFLAFPYFKVLTNLTVRSRRKYHL